MLVLGYSIAHTVMSRLTSTSSEEDSGVVTQAWLIIVAVVQLVIERCNIICTLTNVITGNAMNFTITADVSSISDHPDGVKPRLFCIHCVTNGLVQ